MSSHASAELLSAYLDQQLVAPEARQLEDHIERCHDCHTRLEGLRTVVTNLQKLDPISTPDGLEQAVARRIQLTDRQPNLFDRFEDSMSIFNRQSPILAMFGVVIALVLFIYFFSYTLHLRENTTIPVVFKDLPTAGDEPLGSRLILGDRLLIWTEGGLWVEEGLSADEVDRTLAIDSEEGREFLAAHPELGNLTDLDRSLVIAVGDQVVRLDS